MSWEWQPLDIIQPTPIVDNFEDDPDGPYSAGDDLSTFYSGNLTAFDRVQSTSLQGSYSLEAIEHDPGDYIASVSGDGLTAYPEKGSVFSILVQPGSGGAQETFFGTPENHNSDNLGFGVIVSDGRGELALIRRDGSGTELDTISASVTGGDDYEIVVEWHDGSGSESDDTILVRIYGYDVSAEERLSQVGSLSATDPTFGGESGIAFNEDRYNGPDNYWDAYRVLGDVSRTDPY